jgi:membrane-bound ClpP family serine protease
MGFIITLILVGLILLFAEILIIPGVGVAGILGLLSMGGSCFYAFHEYGNMTGAVVTAVNAVLVVALTVWVLRAKTWKRMSLETNIDSKAVSTESSVLRIGDRGKTLTRVAPMGSARFGDFVVEVKALEGMLDPNVPVEVVLIEDNRIYVKPLNEEF